MNVTIIGAGNMARGIGTRVVLGGHPLLVIDKSGEKAKELVKNLGGSTRWDELNNNIPGEIVIFALPYPAIFEVLDKYKAQLENKILVDISNPINFQTFEMLPPEGSSGAEDIAKHLPTGSKLVKAFNTTFARTLTEGVVDGKPLDVFVASDEKEAGEAVVQLAHDGGLRGLYVGPLKMARILEGMQLIQMSLQEQLGSGWMSALKFLP